jgi:hypothetical protein
MLAGISRFLYFTVEDPAEIKQRLLRLQQKFGYRQETEDSDVAAGFNNIQKRASTLSLVSHINVYNAVVHNTDIYNFFT